MIDNEGKLYEFDEDLAETLRQALQAPDKSSSYVKETATQRKHREARRYTAISNALARPNKKLFAELAEKNAEWNRGRPSHEHLPTSAAKIRKRLMRVYRNQEPIS